MKGDVIVVRYADDFVVGFQHKWEAESFLNDLRGRLAKFGCVRLTDASVASESLAGRKVATTFTPSRAPDTVRCQVKRR